MSILRYKITFMGADDPKGQANNQTDYVWVTGIQKSPTMIGDAKKYPGMTGNDSGMWGWNLRIPLVPVGMAKGAMEGNDHWRYQRLLQRSFAKRWKLINFIEGIDVVGGQNPVYASQTDSFWTELLARFTALGYNGIPIQIHGIEEDYPYDGTINVTINCGVRIPGL